MGVGVERLEDRPEPAFVEVVDIYQKDDKFPEEPEFDDIVIMEAVGGRTVCSYGSFCEFIAN